MDEPVIDHREAIKTKQSFPLLLATGVPLVLLTAIFAGRILWEETFLTRESGPQMLGFSLAHGSFAILFLAPLLLLLWLIVALIIGAVSLVRKKPRSRWYWSTLASAVLTIGLLSIPPVFWQWLFIGTFARSQRAAELMTYAAAEGDVRTVGSYLDHGVPLSAVNYEGSTATFTAAVAGSVPALELLVSRGANVNATNAFGDSPLQAATEGHRTAAITFLEAHGAFLIKGTEEQHQAASRAIAQKQIESLRAR